jgi:hypothetical protein
MFPSNIKDHISSHISVLPLQKEFEDLRDKLNVGDLLSALCLLIHHVTIGQMNQHFVLHSVAKLHISMINDIKQFKKIYDPAVNKKEFSDALQQNRDTIRSVADLLADVTQQLTILEKRTSAVEYSAYDAARKTGMPPLIPAADSHTPDTRFEPPSDAVPNPVPLPPISTPAFKLLPPIAPGKVVVSVRESVLPSDPHPPDLLFMKIPHVNQRKTKSQNFDNSLPKNFRKPARGRGLSVRGRPPAAHDW